MSYKKLFSVIIIVAGCIGFSCTKTLDKLLVNPNSVSPEAADVDLYLNQAQLNFVGFFNSASDYGGQLTRQQVMFGPRYTNAYQPESFDGLWDVYSSVLKYTDAIMPLATEQKKLTSKGIAQVLKAYVFATLVDDFGSIPYSQANLGIENLNPSVDDGKVVYDSIFALLDSAEANFTNPVQGAKPTNDLFYGGSSAKWVTFINTMRLKLYLQTRLVDNTAAAKINALIADGNLIDAADYSEDFNFKFSTNVSAPDSRHPHYVSNYTSSGAGDYIGTYFMYEMLVQKTGSVSFDPRRRYYFYRQQLTYDNANSSTCPCVTQNKPAHYTEDMPFCLIYSGGYWGRDHGDNTGTPPDGNYRTTWGMYPAGGEFDASQGAGITGITYGGKGAGIHPIWNSSFTFFAEAEAALTLGTTGSAEDFLEQGIRASIGKVLSFPAKLGYTIANTALIPTQTGIDAYVNFVKTEYEGATEDEKLNIIMREYYIAAWGNGVEPYNNYRLTGKPDNMQYTRTPDPGLFIRSFYYPSSFVNRNINAPAQKNLGVTVSKVFWDTNPDDFIK